MYKVTRSPDYLQHHGILGMHWGKRNGPPYPLGASDHSASEKKAGWRKSLNKSSSNSKSGLKLTDRQKRAIKIGAAVVATGLVAYGGYKLYQSGSLDSASKLAGDASLDDVLYDSDGFKLLSKPESLEDSLKNTNPNPNDPKNKNNCVYSCVAGHMRHNLGKDVIANSTGGEQQSLGGIIESCFSGARVIDGSAVKFGRSPEDASEMLIKKFGSNASGAVSVQWSKDPKCPLKGGHAFSWEIKDGKVSFFDYKHNRNDAVTRNYWRYIDPNDSLTIARLDNATLVADEAKKCVKNR